MQKTNGKKATKLSSMGFLPGKLRYWSFLVKKNLRRAFSAYATPSSIAMGASIGFFVTMLPIQGFQMMAALPLCRLFKGNFFSAVGPIMLSNPITLPIVFFMSYYTGAFVTGSSTSLSYEFFRTIDINNLWDKLGGVVLPMVLGSIILGVVFALIAYPTFYTIAQRREKDRNKHREMWRTRLAASVSSRIATPVAVHDSNTKQTKVA